MERRLVVVVVLAVAGAAGLLIGSTTAPRPIEPEASPPIAVVPTSTPDPRAASPTRTPTPTAASIADPAAGARGRAVVYFAKPGSAPVSVDAPDARGGSSESDHIFFRLNALRTTKLGGPPEAMNLVATMKARLLEVTIERRGIVTVGYFAPDGDWGVSPEQVTLVLQQIVWTATEEPTIERVRLTQNGGQPAVIAGREIAGELTRETVR